jgi:HSP20 family molecular chaperone IbpA
MAAFHQIEFSESSKRATAADGERRRSVTNHGEQLVRPAHQPAPIGRNFRRTPAFKKRVASSNTAHIRSPGAFAIAPPQALDAAQAIAVEDATFAYTVTMALSGIDPRTVHVLAAPDSLLVEVSVKETYQHHACVDVVRESVHHRVSREFHFPNEIERGCTVIQIRGAYLEIVAHKGKHEQDVEWSDLIRFDTRSSRGCA